MVHFHSHDDDLPTMSARQRDRDRLNKAKQSELDGPTTLNLSVQKSLLSDDQLATQLRLMASSGKTLPEIAKQLCEPGECCKRLAIKHRIPFRTRSFIKKGDAK